MQSSFKKHFQLIVFQKLLDWKLEKSYTKKQACHLDLRQRSDYVTNGQENWVRKLLDNQKGELLDNQKEKLLDKQNSSNQPNQLQIQFVTDGGRPDYMQDGRNTSRSQEINVNSFNDGLSSSDRTGRPVVSEDKMSLKMSLNVEQTHERTGRLVAILHTAAAQDDSQVCHEADTLNVDDEVLRKRMENPLLFMTRIMNRWWWTRQTWTSEFQDYHVPLWNMRKVPAFENWFRKLRTTQIDMLFKKIYNRINHLILSVQNQNKWFRMWVTSNYVNYSRRNPKRSAKYVYHTGTLVLSTARAGTSCVKEEGKISNSSIIRWTFFQFRSTSSRKDSPHGHRYGKKPERQGIFYGQPVEEEVQETVCPRNPWPIHTRSRIP